MTETPAPTRPPSTRVVPADFYYDCEFCGMEAEDLAHVHALTETVHCPKSSDMHHSWLPQSYPASAPLPTPTPLSPQEPEFPPC